LAKRSRSSTWPDQQTEHEDGDVQADQRDGDPAGVAGQPAAEGRARLGGPT
jgi:hypothetical protein